MAACKKFVWVIIVVISNNSFNNYNKKIHFMYCIYRDMII